MISNIELGPLWVNTHTHTHHSLFFFSSIAFNGSRIQFALWERWNFNMHLISNRVASVFSLQKLVSWCRWCHQFDAKFGASFAELHSCYIINKCTSKWLCCFFIGLKCLIHSPFLNELHCFGGGGVCLIIIITTLVKLLSRLFYCFIAFHVQFFFLFWWNPMHSEDDFHCFIWYALSVNVAMHQIKIKCNFSLL